MLQIKLLVLVALLHGRIPADRADVDHAVSELDESTTLLWNIEIGNVVEDELDESLVVVLTDPLNERSGRKRRTHAVGGQTVLGEAVVEVVDN